MRLDINHAAVVVTLSKRNLLTLLHKVDDPLSTRMLVGGYTYLDGGFFDGIELVVRCEPDNAHYADREAPGPVHPRAEAFIGRASIADGEANR